MVAETPGWRIHSLPITTFFYLIDECETINYYNALRTQKKMKLSYGSFYHIDLDHQAPSLTLILNIIQNTIII